MKTDVNNIEKEEFNASVSSEELLEAHTKVKAFLAYLDSSFIKEEGENGE